MVVESEFIDVNVNKKFDLVYVYICVYDIYMYVDELDQIFYLYLYQILLVLMYYNF